MRPGVWRPPVELSAAEAEIVRRVQRAKLFVFLRQHGTSCSTRRSKASWRRCTPTGRRGAHRCRRRSRRRAGRGRARTPSSARAFAAAHGKRLMVLLTYGDWDVVAAVRGKPRFDQSFVDYLSGTGLPVVDGLRKHVEDYAAYRCTPQEYTDRLYVAHYGPQGNHFFAFAIKDEVVAWLDPKPPAYDPGASEPMRHLAATLD